jgi:hypothetical protein
MNRITYNKAEYGGAGVKFTIVIVVLFLLGNAGFNYVPVAYEGESFKQDMQTAVVQGTALPTMNRPPTDAVKEKLMRVVKTDALPADTVVEVKQINNVIQAHVRYNRTVSLLPFGMFQYIYQFDHTAAPTGFITKTT